MVRREVQELAAIFTARMSAWYCCVMTERHTSLRRACFCADPRLGNRRNLVPGEVVRLPLRPLGEVVVAEDAAPFLGRLGLKALLELFDGHRGELSAGLARRAAGR